MLNGYLRCVAGIVEDNRRVVEKLNVHAVMALCSAPISQSEDPANAMPNDRAIRQGVMPVDPDSGEDLPALEPCIGVLNGQVVAGTLGSASRVN